MSDCEEGTRVLMCKTELFECWSGCPTHLLLPSSEENVASTFS